MSTAREQIITATCDLLELQGYHGTGLNEIIRQSGSPKGSLYHYFPGGKEELAAAAVQQVGEVVLRRIRENLAAEADVVLAVRGFIRDVAENVERSGYRAGGPITTVALETAATSERLRLVCGEIYAGWQAVFAARLVAAGWEAARATRVAALIIAALEGGILLSRVERSQRPLLAVAEEVSQLLAAGG